MESENLIGLVTGSLFIATCVLLVYCGKQKIWLEELNKLLETAYMDIASMQKEMNQKSADEGESEKLIVLKENGMKLKDLIKEYGDYEVTIGLMNLLKEPKKESKKSIWEIEEGDEYWSVSEFGDIKIHTWEHDIRDYQRRNCDYCFLTEKEAEKKLKKGQVESLLKKYSHGYEFKPGGNNWFIYCDTYCFELDYEREAYDKTNSIYFACREDAIKAVKEIGEAQLIRDYFQIEENL